MVTKRINEFLVFIFKKKNPVLILRIFSKELTGYLSSQRISRRGLETVCYVVMCSNSLENIDHS